MSTDPPRVLRRQRAELVGAIARHHSREVVRHRGWYAGAALAVAAAIAIVLVSIGGGDGGRTGVRTVAASGPLPTTTDPSANTTAPGAFGNATNLIAQSKPGEALSWQVWVNGSERDAKAVTTICYQVSLAGDTAGSGGCSSRSSNSDDARVIGKSLRSVVLWQVPPDAERVMLRADGTDLPLDVARVGDFALAYAPLPMGLKEATLRATRGSSASGAAVTLKEASLKARAVPNLLLMRVGDAVRPGVLAWYWGTELRIEGGGTVGSGNVNEYVIVAQDPPPGTEDLATSELVLTVRAPEADGPDRGTPSTSSSVPPRRQLSTSEVATIVKQSCKVSPILLPTAVPTEWIVDIIAVQDTFTVWYRSPDGNAVFAIRIAVPNPPTPLQATRQEHPVFRGDAGALYQVDNDRDPKSRRELVWHEPGGPTALAPQLKAVPYDVSAAGIDETLFWKLANSLAPV